MAHREKYFLSPSDGERVRERGSLRRDRKALRISFGGSDKFVFNFRA